MPSLHGYDPTEEYTGFGNIPAGAYNAIITESKEVKNKKTPGTHLALTFSILDGPQKNRKVWTRLNLQNESQQTVRISRSELKNICTACGGIRPTDSVQLHNIPMVIHVKTDDNGFDRIKKYESRGGATVDAATVEPPEPATTVASDRTGNQPVQSASLSPPWKK